MQTFVTAGPSVESADWLQAGRQSPVRNLWRTLPEPADKAFKKIAGHCMRSQIYKVIKKVKAGKLAGDQRHCNPTKTIRPAAFFADLAADIEKYRYGQQDTAIFVFMRK